MRVRRGCNLFHLREREGGRKERRKEGEGGSEGRKAGRKNDIANPLASERSVSKYSKSLLLKVLQ